VESEAKSIYNGDIMAKVKMSIKQIDKQLGDIARKATGDAHQRALKTGRILIYRNGKLEHIEAGAKNIYKKKVLRVEERGLRFKIKPVAE
jgi:hypothetical protein